MYYNTILRLLEQLQNITNDEKFTQKLISKMDHEIEIWFFTMKMENFYENELYLTED
jgi:hypothetical protein